MFSGSSTVVLYCFVTKLVHGNFKHFTRGYTKVWYLAGELVMEVLRVLRWIVDK
jgi:hypothetical protein